MLRRYFPPTARPQRCDITRYRILAGPERIESCWWDGRDCRRDYFIVRDAGGGTLWAFHEYKPRRGWFLHAVFGQAVSSRSGNRGPAIAACR
jgi:protein ImuB